MKAVLGKDIAMVVLVINKREEIMIMKDVGKVDVQVSFSQCVFSACTIVDGATYVANGQTWDDALIRLKVVLRRNKLTGVMKIVANKRAIDNKSKYYWNCSPIPGDSYKELITPYSSVRDSCRSLCD